ncbi:MAG: hypothetical protein WCK28_16490 [Burkholderiales bacterium]|jgi:hypothetical protein
MNSRTRYRDEPIGEPRVVADFLPSPDQLAFRDDEVKVTLTLSRRSIEFFKGEALRSNAPYQRMIRRLLDAYVEAWTAQSATAVSPARTSARRRASKSGAR